MSTQTKPKRDSVTIPRAEYERLKALEREVSEDIGTARLVARAKKEISEGAPVVSMAAANRLANGENPIRVLRQYREKSQEEMCAAIGIAQGYLSELETGKRKGPLSLHQKIARCLGVPLDLLATIAVSDKDSEPQRFAKGKAVTATTRRQRGQR